MNLLSARRRQLVHATWAFGLGASLGCTPSTPFTGSAVSRGAWIRVWSDEFDGAAGARIDSTKWRYDTADGCGAGICGWGNDEKEYYTDSPANIALSGQGQLLIVARRAPAGLTCHYGPCRYTSAKVTTRGKMHIQPGRVEARIKLPAGQGLWPAFWMLGRRFPATPWPECGELDVMENRGSEPATTSSAVHGPGYSGNTPLAHAHSLERGTFSDDFHTFTVEWDSLAVRFFVDDTVHYRVTRSEVEQFGKSVLDQSFFLVLNLAIGGTFDGSRMQSSRRRWSSTTCVSIGRRGLDACVSRTKGPCGAPAGSALRLMGGPVGGTSRINERHQA